MGERTLDLARRRDIGDLLGDTFSLFGRHALLFWSVTLIVVAPGTIVVDGFWGEGFAEGADAVPGPAPAIASGLLNTFVVPSLVTAIHVGILLSLARGEVPGIGRALVMTLDRAGAVIATTILYTLALVVGFLLLIVPGVWISVKLYFGAQAAVVDRASPVAALRRSAELTQGRWWSTFGRLLLAALLFGMLIVITMVPAALLPGGVTWVLVLTLATSLFLSLSALFGTLLLFDLRADHGEPVPGAAAPGPFAGQPEWIPPTA